MYVGYAVDRMHQASSIKQLTLEAFCHHEKVQLEHYKSDWSHSTLRTNPLHMNPRTRCAQHLGILSTMLCSSQIHRVWSQYHLALTSSRAFQHLWKQVLQLAMIDATVSLLRVNGLPSKDLLQQAKTDFDGFYVSPLLLHPCGVICSLCHLFSLHISLWPFFSRQCDTPFLIFNVFFSVRSSPRIWLECSSCGRCRTR